MNIYIYILYYIILYHIILYHIILYYIMYKCVYIGNGNSNVSGNNDQRVAGGEKKNTIPGRENSEVIVICLVVQ